MNTKTIKKSAGALRGTLSRTAAKVVLACLILVPASMNAHFCSSFFGSLLGATIGSTMAQNESVHYYVPAPEYQSRPVYAHPATYEEYEEYPCGCEALVTYQVVRGQHTLIARENVYTCRRCNRRGRSRYRRHRSSHESASNSVASGLLGFGIGTAFGAALNS